MRFQPGWYSFDLGKYRPCDGTYRFYPYESLPPLAEAQFKNNFHWLTPLDQTVDQQMEIHRPSAEHQQSLTGNLKTVYEQAQQLNLTLPDTFLYLMGSRELQHRIPSCTACYFELAEKLLPCPGTKDAYIVHFLRDQQDCLIWYLYLTPGKEPCVLVSDYYLTLLADPTQVQEYGADEIDETNAEQILRNTLVAAPSFEEFIYRFWLENTLWFKLNEIDAPFTPNEQHYLDHYSQSQQN